MSFILFFSCSVGCLDGCSSYSNELNAQIIARFILFHNHIPNNQRDVCHLQLLAGRMNPECGMCNTCIFVEVRAIDINANAVGLKAEN